MKENKFKVNQDLPMRATHEEICDMALKHYEKISMEHPSCEWCSTVPKAIKFYKKYGRLDKEKEGIIGTIDLTVQNQQAIEPIEELVIFLLEYFPHKLKGEGAIELAIRLLGEFHGRRGAKEK